MKPLHLYACASLVLLATASAAPLVLATAGTVAGRVVFDGKPPEPQPLKIEADKSKGCCPEGQSVSTKDPGLLIDEKGGIANCVVTIAVEGAKVEPLKEPVSIDQKGCHFEPHVVVAPVGSKVVFLNSDTCTHNIHTFARKSDPLNKAVGKGDKLEMLLEHKEVVQVRCDYHPWMMSWIVATDTPFWALTKADGSFEIAGLKAGTYKAEVWHEQLGKLKIDVTVAADGSAALGDLKLGLKKKL